jgi:hypothetical protein
MHRQRTWLKIFTTLLFLSIPHIGQAALNIKLSLSCNIIFDNYSGFKDTSISKDIVLTNYKHKPGGMIKISELHGFEFWAMIYSVQRINNQTLINSFQVAIKDKATNLFMHALSDIVFTTNTTPNQARISLVDYWGNGQEEKGELLFECRNLRP